MEIIVVTGFLGSGKTTLILPLARIYASRGIRTAVIENDTGSIPVDSAYLEGQGIVVKELSAGCICCSLRSELGQAVQEIRDTFAPDILLVEPSGVAGPDIAAEALRSAAAPGDTVRAVLIVDYRRSAAAGCPADYLMRNPFLERSLQVCELVLINRSVPVCPSLKTLQISPDLQINPAAHTHMEELTERLKKVSGKAAIPNIDVRSLEEVLSLIDSSLWKGKAEQREKDGSSFAAVVSPNKDFLGKPAAVAYTLENRIRGLSSPESDQLWLSLIPIGSLTPIGSLLKNIARGVREAAPSAIGHLKGVLSSRSISIAFSLTDFTAENLQSSKAGDLSSYESIPGSKWTLVINAVAYGISERLLSEIGSRCWEAFKMELAAD